MIEKILEIIRNEVNHFVGRKLNDTTLDNRVVLTSFVDDEGRVVIPEDSLGLSLLNIEEEKILKTAGLLRVKKAEDSTSFVNQPIRLNLQIMFTAYFNNYYESLKHISFILACLQTKPVFSKDNTPAMNDLDITTLTFELNTLGLEQQHYIWSMIGLRYLPSIIYQVRTLMMFEQDIVKEVVNTNEINTLANLKSTDD